jgi:hypothetical protein
LLFSPALHHRRTKSLLDKTPHAWEKAIDWSGRNEEFVKRAGFSLMAYLAVHDKKAPIRGSRSSFRSSSARQPTTATS